MHGITQRFLTTAALIVSIAGAGCSGTDGGPDAVRETLPNGATLVRYTSVPSAREDTVAPDLRIGLVDGPAEEILGSVLGIEAGPDGTIYVLDQQAMEVRSFGPDGSYMRTLARAGGGPGELADPHGLVLAPDGILWIQDPGAGWALIGLSPGGREVGRIPMIVRSYRGSWAGAVDGQGRFWEIVSHSDNQSSGTPEAGLSVRTSRVYYKSYDQRTKQYDSIFLTDVQRRFFVMYFEGGYSSGGVPGDPTALAIVDIGADIWQANSDSYRIVRRASATGDTVVVLEVDARGPALTEQVRNARRRFVPEDKRELQPVMRQILVDDERRLWVGRTVASGEAALYDVFRVDGEYLGSVRMPPDVETSIVPPRIKYGQIYALARDTFDVQTVIRAPVPAFRGR